MGEVFPGVPVGLARTLVEGLGLTLAVETGTHLGESTRALRSLVPEVVTVELSSDYLGRAREALADLDGIRFEMGRSEEVLARLATSLTQPAFFWLDAHWCELGTAGAEAQCPVLGEIAAVNSAPAGADCVMVIDDARFFLGAPTPNYRRSDWPTFMEVADALRAPHPRYVTVLADCIIAAPPRARPMVEAWYHERNFIRLREERDAALQERDNAIAGRDAEAERSETYWKELKRAWDPAPATAVRRLAKALLPASAISRLRRR